MGEGRPGRVRFSEEARRRYTGVPGTVSYTIYSGIKKTEIGPPEIEHAAELFLLFFNYNCSREFLKLLR
jgi:hypothetical protein